MTGYLPLFSTRGIGVPSCPGGFVPVRAHMVIICRCGMVDAQAMVDTPANGEEPGSVAV